MSTSTPDPTPRVAYQDDWVTLWHGRMETVLPLLASEFDAAVVDPPYGETSLAWDSWIADLPALIARYTRSMWFFGSAKLFGENWGEFTSAGWRLSQDVNGADGEPDDVVVTWEKVNGTGFATDRFRRVHEYAYHWYLDRWATVHHEVPRMPAVYDAKGRTAGRSSQPSHTGRIDANVYRDDGLRLARSIVHVPSVRRGISRTQKPEPLVRLLVQYAVPPGGVVLDPTAGSCTTGVCARALGRRAVLVERDADQCAQGAERLRLAAAHVDRQEAHSA